MCIYDQFSYSSVHYLNSSLKYCYMVTFPRSIKKNLCKEIPLKIYFVGLDKWEITPTIPFFTRNTRSINIFHGSPMPYKYSSHGTPTTLLIHMSSFHYRLRWGSSSSQEWTYLWIETCRGKDSHVKLPLQTTIFTKDGGAKVDQIATSHYLGPNGGILIWMNIILNYKAIDVTCI